MNDSYTYPHEENADKLTLAEIMADLSRAAFELAKAMAAQVGDTSTLIPHARELDAALDKFVPLIMAAPIEEQDALKTQWSDARLDLTYVLANGQAPASLRLYHFLQQGA